MAENPAPRPSARDSDSPSSPTGLLTGPPPLRDLVAQVGWVLLVLRAFLAVVFLYAGIDKISDRAFLDSNSVNGIHATIQAIRGNSPIGSLLGPVEDHSFALGLFMSIAEIAVGIGLALGLFTRIAALGGLFVTLSLFLTVSWGATPWYTGADIVYVFALTPLVIAGSGGVYSLDAWLAAAARRQPGVTEDRNRRVLLGGLAAVGVLAVLGVSALARGAKAGNADGPDPDPTGTTPASAGDGVLVAASAVAVGNGKLVKEAQNDDHPIWVLQLTEGTFTALDAECPHEKCTVGFISPSAGFGCPCHQSKFAADGKLLDGPATRGLAVIPVTVTDGSVRRA